MKVFEQVGPEPPRPRRRMRLPMIAMALTAVVVLIAGFSALWFESREEAAQALERQRAQELALQQQRQQESSAASAEGVTTPDSLSIEQDLLNLERQLPPPDDAAAPAEAVAAGELPADRAARASADGAPDVSGTWHLATHIRSASVDAYEGLRLGFRVQLTQDGDRLVGRGQKWTENGRGLSPEARTPIALRGTIKGRRAKLQFAEEGARRASGGRIDVELTSAGELRGTFRSDAAKSRGTVYARRAR